MSDDFDVLPHMDIHAEQAVLGAVLQSADAASVALERLRADHFVRGAHKLVFEAVVGLSERGAPVDVLSVKGVIEDHKQITAVDAPYLFELISSVPAVVNIDYWIERILDKAEQREIASAGVSFRGIADDPDLEREARVDAAWRVMERITNTTTATPMQSVADLIMPTLERLEKGDDSEGVSTGWSELEGLVPKLKPGQLITIGARPGVGKSVVMANIAFHVGVNLGRPVFFGTLEMSSHELNLRLIANAGKVNLKRLENPAELTNHDWERIGEAQEVLAKADNLFIDDEPTMNIAYIRSRLRSMRRNGNSPALVVVDYLQLMSAGKRVESRQLEVSEFARSLKLMAKEFETPIIVGSQLNRLVEQRANKRPTMSDLRESGSIEQDSNVVILLHREDYHDPESPRAGEIDLIVDKNRSGPRGTAVLSWQGHYARCGDMPQSEPPSEPQPDWSPTAVLEGRR